MVAPTVALTTIFTVISTSQTSTAAEFQMAAAVNDNRSEVVDDEGWIKEIVLPASKADGVRVDLLKGQNYRLEISGTFAYAKNSFPTTKPRIADAECAIDPEGHPATAFQWQSERFKGWGSDLLDVNVKNSGAPVSFQWLAVDPYAPLSTGGEVYCSKVNKYFADITAPAWYITFVVDDRYFVDNIGDLQISVSRKAFSAPRIYEGKGYQCPKWTAEKEQLDPTARIGGIAHADLMLDSHRDTIRIKEPYKTDAFGNHYYDFNQETGHWGMYTCNWSLPDTSYRIVVDGVWKWEHDDGTLALADAECSTGSKNYEGTDWAEDRTDPRGMNEWMAHRYVDDRDNTNPADDVDYLDLFVNRFKNLDWKPMYPDPDNPLCAGDADHTYVIENWVPDRTGPIMFEVGDWDYAEIENVGMLCIHVEKSGAAPHDHDAPAATQTHDIKNVSDFIDSHNNGLGG